jgi:predicted adenine nucleotide alpha hydrolase (AANH) superfamily ATPase
LYPAQVFKEDGIDFTGYFHNPNIHPYKEFKRRLDAVLLLAERRDYRILVDRDYGLQGFLRAVVFKERERCRFCYSSRIERTAKLAAKQDFSGFSSTLLYSKYQNHKSIVAVSESIAATSGIPFVYRDFRHGWQTGIDESIALEIYRQSYCGCIYSEQERYDNRLKKQLKKEREQNV